MADQGKLLNIFNNLILEQKPATMDNTYYDLPFTHDADILALEKGNVAARVYRHHSDCLGLKIFPSPELEPLLEEYITKQQQAILHDIELTYHSMCQEDSRQG
jgi:hypothetical protein